MLFVKIKQDSAKEIAQLFGNGELNPWDIESNNALQGHESAQLSLNDYFDPIASGFEGISEIPVSAIEQVTMVERIYKNFRCDGIYKFEDPDSGFIVKLYAKTTETTNGLLAQEIHILGSRVSTVVNAYSTFVTGGLETAGLTILRALGRD